MAGEISVPIRWDIVEEHLDEAAFLYGQWEDALRSPLYTLAEIAAGPEERMLAHLDGLVLGGPPVGDRLLLPALGADEPGWAFAAAFALVNGDRPEDFQAVIDALKDGEPVQRSAIRRALSVVPRPDLGQRLARLASNAPPALQANILEVLGYLRVDPGLRLEPLLAHDEGLAIRLARVFPDKLDPVAIMRGLSSPEPAARSAAFETSIIAGRPQALSACEAEVSARGPAFGTAALILGLSGDKKAAAALIPALRDKKLAPEAAFALGFSGMVSAADALLEAMADDQLAPVAADGFAAITGLAIDKRFAQPPKPWNPDEEETEENPDYGPQSDLPKPEFKVIARWWKETRPQLDPAGRWLCGQPWSVERLLRELEAGPARRRASIALQIAVYSRGQIQITTDSLAARQQTELTKARTEVGRSSQRRPA